MYLVETGGSDSLQLFGSFYFLLKADLITFWLVVSQDLLHSCRVVHLPKA